MFHLTVCESLVHTLLLGALALPPRVGPVSMPADSDGVLGLPVVEVRAGAYRDSTLAVLLSGDGGWAAGDRTIAATLARAGMSVVGLDVPSYLAVARTPEGASADLQRLLEHYLGSWHKRRVILIGYSHGANIAPFMVSRLPDSLRRRIDLLAMVGLEDHAAFGFHLADVVADVRHEGDLPVLPEVEKLRGLPMLCLRGRDDRRSLCPALPAAIARVETMSGGHRVLGREGGEVGTLILSAVRAPSP
jgi:type IV secretory pathway VirJ component